MSDRDSAVVWWVNKSQSEKMQLATKHFNGKRYYQTLTGSEVEKIWKQEFYPDKIAPKQ